MIPAVPGSKADQSWSKIALRLYKLVDYDLKEICIGTMSTWRKDCENRAHRRIYARHNLTVDTIKIPDTPFNENRCNIINCMHRNHSVNMDPSSVRGVVNRCGNFRPDDKVL